MKSWIILAVFMAVLCLGFGTVSMASDASLKNKQPEDRVLGNPNAKVTLIEYASLSCSHCASFHTQILPVIQKEYIDTGKVQLVFRDFPLNAPALIASQLAQCLGEDGNEKYFAALKLFFAEQSNWAFDKDFKEKLTPLANKLGMEKQAIDSCLNNKKIETAILTSRKNAEQLGINSTPGFLVNSEKIEHMHSLDEVRKALDSALAGKSLKKETMKAAKKAITVKADDMVLGNKKAAVTIVEYSNIACPHCGQFHKMLLSALQKDYIDTGKVKLVFRELPMNQAAFYAYMTAHCKGKDEFFNTLSLLIDETQSWASTPAFISPLRTVAEKAGIGKEAFYSCLENKDAENRILAHGREAGDVLGIKHSPAIYINGEKAEGLNSPDSVRAVIDAALKK